MTARKKLQSGFFLPMLLAILVAFVIGFFANMSLQKSGFANKFLSLGLKPDKKTDEITLPSDLVKISGCIPFEGEHFVRAQDIPHGPFYVIHNGKLMAMEYMFELKDIPGEEYAEMTFPQLITHMQSNKLALKDIVNELQTLKFDLPKANYTYMDIHWTAPHAGVLNPHYDLHLYVAEKEEMNTVCPDSTLQDVLPEDLVKDLINSGVPLPKP